MPKIENAGGKIRYSIERFDGGLNTSDNPTLIDPTESPDCLNVVFDDRGAVNTRPGSAKWNTTAIGSFPVDWGISYSNNQIVWANGTMYTTSGVSGTTFTAITQSSGKFSTGVKVAAIVYQNILFTSDGTNGPWKYSGDGNFYNMGIDTPNPPVASGTSAGCVSTGTYYYAVSFVNSQVVEGDISAASNSVTISSSSTIGLTSIPVGSSLAGVNARYIYRAEAASGPFRYITTVSGNTITTLADTVPNGAEGKPPILDGTKPDAFKTIDLHKERLFFDSAEDRSFLRYTEIGNPFIAPGANEEPILQGNGESIVAIASQDSILIAFKENFAQGIITVDPADDTTWQKADLPTNLGIVSAKAWTRMENGIMFIGRQYKKLTGLHYLTGLQVVEGSDGKLRSLTMSKKVEPTLLEDIAQSAYSSVVLSTYGNRLYFSFPFTTTSTNNRIMWLDLTRVGMNGQPGSWSFWSGINANCFYTHNGLLFSGDSTSTGFVRQLNKDDFNDSGSAIDSYFWTKQIGGEKEGVLDSYFKDLREIYLWVEQVGTYYMNARVRTDGDTSNGVAYPIYLDTTSSLWGTAIWGVDTWGTARTNLETRIPMGYLGRRFQIRFDNQNTIDQGFKVHRLELGFNLRRRR